VRNLGGPEKKKREVLLQEDRGNRGERLPEGRKKWGKVNGSLTEPSGRDGVISRSFEVYAKERRKKK